MATNYDMPRHHQQTLSIESAVVSEGANIITDAAFNPESSITFILLTLGLLGVTIWRPQIDCAREFYRNCFEKNCWWKGPPRKWVFDLIWFLMDVLIVAAIDNYLFIFANPRDGDRENYYLGVFGVFLAFLAFRYFYINSFWNYHNKKSFIKGDIYYSWEASVALGFAIFFAFLMWAALIVLSALLFSASNTIWDGIFLLFPIIWTTLLFIWTIAVYRCLPHCDKIAPKKCALSSKRQ